MNQRQRHKDNYKAKAIMSFNVNGTTQIFGIFGFPIKHTLSPAMHNAAFAALKLDCVYLPFEVKPADLQAAILSISALNIKGVNITIPHKEKVIDYLDKIDPLARKIGSVNTIVNKDGVLTGYNTDGSGFIKDIKTKGFEPKQKTALLLGAGGAGRSIALSLAWAGIEKIFITDADESRAALLADSTPQAEFVSMTNWKEKIHNSDILINATPVGMHKGDSALVEKNLLRRDIFIYDIIYNRKTELVKSGEAISAKSFNGLGMLLNQGALAFELWTGKKPHINTMRKALVKAISVTRR